MLHQPLGGARGQATEIEISARRILKLKDHINQIISERTGQPIEKVAKDTDRDNFLSAIEAKDYGIIDEIIVQDN
jgi:ATP-dependent Clp protease protease subunit